jgi:hypothetical protein
MADNLAAFPDLHFEIEQLITEGDLGRDGRVGPCSSSSVPSQGQASPLPIPVD